MDNSFYVPPEKYRIVTFDLYYLAIPSYYWLNGDFSACYRFLSFPEFPEKNKTQKLFVVQSSNPNGGTFDEYNIEYDEKGEHLFIMFLNDRFKVERLKAYYGAVNAQIMHLISSKGQSHIFYAATKHPFSPKIKEIYGVKQR